jgi:hypothetical protein
LLTIDDVNPTWATDWATRTRASVADDGTKELNGVNVILDDAEVELKIVEMLGGPHILALKNRNMDLVNVTEYAFESQLILAVRDSVGIH